MILMIHNNQRNHMNHGSDNNRGGLSHHLTIFAAKL